MRKSEHLSRWQAISNSLGFGGHRKQGRLQSHKRRSLRLEPLESRQLLTVLYWDPNHTGGAGGGTGNWTGGSTWWNGSADVAWVSGSEAAFQGTAGTVTVNSAVTASKIDFYNVDGYTVSGANTLTLNGTGTVIDSPRSATINSNLSMTTSSTATWSESTAGKRLTFGGTATFGSGTLSVEGAGETYFSGNVTQVGAEFNVANGGTATFAAGSLTVSTIYVGYSTAGTLNWNTSGTLTSTYVVGDGYGGAGTITQTNGSVVCTNPSYWGLQFQANSSTYNLQGGTLQIGVLNSNSSTGCSLNFGGAGSATLTATGNLLNGNVAHSLTGTNNTINTNGYSISLPGPMSGTGGFTKSGAGTLTIGGTGNTNSYSGGTTVSAGTLLAGSDSAFGTGALVANGGTTDLNTHNISVSSLSGTSGTIAVGTGSLNFGDSTNQTFGGVMTGWGYVGKHGSGTETLTGANTCAGGIAICTGTLLLSGGNNRLSTSGSITLCGGTLNLGGNTQSTSTGVFSQYNDGSVVQNGTLILTGGSNGVSITANQSLTINAAISVTTADQVWTVASGKTLALGGAVTFTSRQLVIQGAGTTTFSGAVSGSDFRTNTGGTATFTGSSSLTTTTFTLAGSGSSGTINWNSSGALTPTDLYVGWGGSGTITQTAGTVNVTDSTWGGLLFYPGSNYYLNGGTLSAKATSAPYGVGVMNFGGGTLRPTGSFTFDANVSYSTTASTTSTIDTQGYSLTLPGALSGSGNLTKAGTGTLTLSGSNGSYSGTTTISAGVLKAGSSTALGNNSSVVVTNGDNGHLDLNGQSIGSGVLLGICNGSNGGAIQNSSVSTATFAGNITLNGSAYIGTGSGSMILSGNITDNGNGYYLCTGYATQTITLSGNNTFARLAPWGGTVRLGSNTALSSSTQVDFYTGDVLDVNGYSVAIGKLFSYAGQTGTITLGSGTLTFGDSTNQTFGGTISGSGQLVKQGSGKETLSGTLSYTGQTTATAGTIELLSHPASTWVENGGHVIGPGSLTFYDSGISTQVYNAYNNDHVIDRNEMITILTSAESGGITSNELSDLTAVANNPFRLQMMGYASSSNPGYVDVLAADVVLGNPANANYQGSPLSGLNGYHGLTTSTSGATLDDLINKWFKGTDHPNAYDPGTEYTPQRQAVSPTYQTASGTLFGGGNPSPNDMIQGNCGDCYFIAGLGSIADSDYHAIQNMFVDNGDNTWTIRFYYYSSGSYVADYVTVDKSLPVNNGTFYYADCGEAYGNSSNILWIPLAEKAYAQWNETGREGRDGTNTYLSLWNGSPYYVDYQILGATPAWYNMGSQYSGLYYTDQSIMYADVSSNYAVTITTKASGTTYMVANHVYAITGFDANGNYIVRNPWGSGYDLTLTWDQLWTDCVQFYAAYASNTSPFNNQPSIAGAVLGSGTQSGLSNRYLELAAAMPNGSLAASAVDSVFDQDDTLPAINGDLSQAVRTIAHAQVGPATHGHKALSLRV